MSNHNHKESDHYHPVTKMYYKKDAYGFKFYKGKKFHAFAKDGVIEIWHPSGMKRGFIEIKSKEASNETK
tara:strand:+ start:231 stop:440 length:210 start_codon:yes stop_codon:yes gene_type:complete